LQKKYPKGHFIMLLGKKNKGIAELLPIKSEIFVYEKSFLHDLMMLRELRKRKIDVLIDLMDNPSSTSSLLIPLIAPKYSVGIKKENEVSYSITVPLLDRSKYHISRRLLELAKPFGIDPDQIPLRPVLRDLHAEKKEGRIGLVLSAGVEDRELPLEVNSEIASKIIANAYAKEVILFCHPSDRQRFSQMVKGLDTPHVVLAQLANSFAEYAEQLASCEIIITPDTSAVHLSSAYGIPAVVITNPFPPTLHYWTPIGVPFELIVSEPSVKSANADVVIVYLEKLLERVKTEKGEVIPV